MQTSTAFMQDDLQQIEGMDTYFSGLTFSTAANGDAMTFFPAGTEEVFARWNYVNVPAEPLTLHRDWYRDGQLEISRQSEWSYTATGWVNDISIFDYETGLAPGNYQVFIYLSREARLPGAQVIAEFSVAEPPAVIAASGGSMTFTNLTVGTSASGAAQTMFPAGTTAISVRWDYNNIPTGAVVIREWHRNGSPYHIVQEPWSSYWGSSGRLTHVTLYDYVQGLPSGDWSVIVYLRDNPQAIGQAQFTIGSNSDGSSYFRNLIFSTQSGGPDTLWFHAGTSQIFAQWDFQNVPGDAIVLRRWYRNGVLWLERREAWVYGSSGRVQDVSIYNFEVGLLPGQYAVEIELEGYPGSLVWASFMIE
jgi:hypothetical protein